MDTKNSNIRTQELQLRHVDLYCDGSCTNNPGSGGWAAVLIYKDYEKWIHDYVDNTTNNQMEITAVIKGLEVLKERCDVTVYTDSMYVVNTMTKGWKRNKNADLWKQLDELVSKHKVTFVWVKGHSGNYYNEKCDKLARAR
jgi:ribonuclease HI